MSDSSTLPPEPEVAPEGRSRSAWRQHLALKLPEILLEATSVVFAILLAFGVDQWREERSQRALAARARQTILTELRANRDEIRRTLAANRKVAEAMQQQIALLKARRTTEIQTVMHLAQLSAAAFEAAQSTQALQFVDYDWLVMVGRTYEIQRTYVASQQSALLAVGGAGGAIDRGDKPLAVLQGVKGQLSMVDQLGQGVLGAYEETLSK